MQVDNLLFRGLRKFNKLKLSEAAIDICTASALSQFESGKINLTSRIKQKLLEKYGVKLIPHEADIGYLKRQVTTFSQSLEKFYYPASGRIYDFLLKRIGSLYYDVNLLIDSFNVMITYELLQIVDLTLAQKRIVMLKGLEHQMTSIQLQKFYFNLGIVDLMINRNVDQLVVNFSKCFENMEHGRNSFIIFWYAYSMKYFGRKIMAVKYYLEAETMFKLENNTLGVENVLLELAEVFLIVNEIGQAKYYLDSYNDRRMTTRKALISNDCLFNLIRGELEFRDRKLKKALTYFENAQKHISSSLVDQDLGDYVITSLMKIYKEVDESKYREIVEYLKNELDLLEVKYSTAFLLDNEFEISSYSDYVCKVVNTNKYEINKSINKF